MIDPNGSAAMWWWLVAVMIPAAVVAGWRLWVIDQRERVQRLRLEGFRGPSRVRAQQSSWSRFGSRVAPFVGVVEQQRMLKRLAAAGFKHHGSLATFIALKGISAVTLDSRILLGALALSTLTGVLFGIGPALAASRPPRTLGRATDCTFRSKPNTDSDGNRTAIPIQSEQ